MQQYFISHPDDIREVLVTQASKFIKDAQYRDPRTGIARYLGNGLLTSDGEFWRRQRRLVAPAFHPNRIESYAATMVDNTDRMLTGWRDGERLVIAFNIASAIPVGSKINSVTLTLHMSRTVAGAENITLHRLLAEWGMAPPTQLAKKVKAPRQLPAMRPGYILSTTPAFGQPAAVILSARPAPAPRSGVSRFTPGDPLLGWSPMYKAGWTTPPRTLAGS